MDFVWRFIIFAVVIVTLVALYALYGDVVRRELFGQGDEYTVYVNQTAFEVTVADSETERTQGLSGTPPLAPQHGKLFVFDRAAKYGIWMKDMQYPLDILWFDDSLKLIHIEENVTPATYPAIFAPREPARFVLELTAYSARNFGLTVGQTLTLPTAVIPSDVAHNLQ